MIHIHNAWWVQVVGGLRAVLSAVRQPLLAAAIDLADPDAAGPVRARPIYARTLQVSYVVYCLCQVSILHSGFSGQYSSTAIFFQDIRFVPS